MPPFLSPKGDQGVGGHGITTSLDTDGKTPPPVKADPVIFTKKEICRNGKL